LSGIYVYPIKSAGGIALETATVVERGLQYDRRWMIVDAKGKFLTQRQLPRLSLISVRISLSHLVVDAPDMPTIRLPLQPNSDYRLPVQIWKGRCEAVHAGEDAARWFSHFLNLSCQLVYMPKESSRHVRAQYAVNNEAVSFADAFPFLLTSEASLADLNKRMTAPVPMHRFRPNLVVTGGEAFAEDCWQQIRISSITFYLVKPCARCSTVMVNQATGVREKEPIATLARFRKRSGKVYFGQNLVHEGRGVLRLADKVVIVR
jgi:uncharacterized protein